MSSGFIHKVDVTLFVGHTNTDELGVEVMISESLRLFATLKNILCIERIFMISRNQIFVSGGDCVCF